MFPTSKMPWNTTPSRAPLRRNAPPEFSFSTCSHPLQSRYCAFCQRERSARRAAPHNFHGAPSPTKLSMNNMEWTFSGSYQEIPQILPFFDQCNFGASLRSKTSKYGGLTLRRPRSGWKMFRHLATQSGFELPSINQIQQWKRCPSKNPWHCKTNLLMYCACQFGHVTYHALLCANDVKRWWIYLLHFGTPHVWEHLYFVDDWARDQAGPGAVGR